MTEPRMPEPRMPEPRMPEPRMPEPRWLTPQEQAAWRSFVDGFRALVDVLDRQLQTDSNLSHAYYEVLVPLSEEPCHALRMSELADRARSSRSRLSHAVSRLEERGLVERQDCATDKRGQLARLTDAGFAAVQAAAPGHVAAVRRYLIDRLSPQQLAVMGELGQVMLASASGSPAPSGTLATASDAELTACDTALVGSATDPLLPGVATGAGSELTAG